MHYNNFFFYLSYVHFDYQHQFIFTKYTIQEWGFELPSESICNNATTKCTDFLLATASGKVEGERVSGKIVTPFEKTKVAAYTFGAVAPTMRLFAFIGSEIQAVLDHDDSSNTYKRWIDHYSSEDFEVICQFIYTFLSKHFFCLSFS